MGNAARMMLLMAVVAACLPGLAAAAPGCPPEGWSRDRLGALKSASFAMDSGARPVLALALLPCLADPLPGLRDGIAFEAWSTWLRAGQLDERTRLDAVERLMPALVPDAVDAEGFRQPFSALVLSELARADRLANYLPATQRQRLLETGASYLEGIRDYRGFDAEQGWRHGVAHGADLLMQLALNEAVGKSQLDRILAAVATQVAPAGSHSYIVGEPERLARPVLVAGARGLHSAQEWDAWFKQLAAPAPLASWDQAFASAAGLARRHNTRAFLLGVYAAIRDSKNEKLIAMQPAVKAALEAVP